MAEEAKTRLETEKTRFGCLMEHDLFGEVPPKPFSGVAQTVDFPEPDQKLTSKMVQVAPGRWTAGGGEDPEHILAEVFRHPDGTLGFRPSGYGRLVKLDGITGQLLGFAGQLATVRRLARAGFIRFYQPSPGVHLLDLDSWFAHLDATEDDPDFWDPEGPNLRRYLLANGLRV